MNHISMSVITDADRRVRQREIDLEHITALKKRGGAMSKIILQSRYGEDFDFQPGFDDGESPKKLE